MSCFPGTLDEFPGVSIDNFANENFNSTVYFLSHCHSDHMVGLASPKLRDRFHDHPYIRLYCHKVSKALLAGLDQYNHLINSIEVLELQEEKLISIYDSQGIESSTATVSIIPAGHCPGSVMFLLSSNSGCTVLYTGDFRVNVGDTVKIRELFDEYGNMKFRISRVYIDTTFCTPAAKFIPTREACCNSVIKTIREWLNRDSQRIVHVLSRSNYGYEYLMSRLASEFSRKLHVTEQQYQRYRFVRDIHKHLSVDIRDAGRIHFCQLSVDGTIPKCISNSSNVLTIIPTAMYFTKSLVTPKEMVKCITERTIRVCYSTHCSYNEIIDFLKNIKPDKIQPCVEPNDSQSLDDVRRSLFHLERKTCLADFFTKPELVQSQFSLKRKRKMVGF